ncbi:MAG TPA: nucleoside kinase, partial [Spirochaetia bacterium]|nr:nucleoside kinase [Spirochaetia bacterium]
MNVRVTFPGGQSRDFPAGTPVSTVTADPAFPQSSLPVVAALLNNEVVSLHHELAVNCRAAPVDLGTKAGITIYRRSLCLLLAMAVTRAFPKRRLIVGHSLGDGYFYHFDG